METVASLTIKATSNDYIKWQILKEDGITPISIENVISITLRLKNKVDATIKEFKTTDNPQKLFIVDAANGKIELRPVSGDFPSVASYKFQTIIVDSIGDHYVPEDRDYTLKVISSYPP